MMAALLLLLLLLCLMGSLDSETVRKLAPGLLSGALSLSPHQDGKNRLMSYRATPYIITRIFVLRVLERCVVHLILGS